MEGVEVGGTLEEFSVTESKAASVKGRNGSVLSAVTESSGNTTEKDLDLSGADAAKFRGPGEGHRTVTVGVALLPTASRKMRAKSLLQFIRIVSHARVISVQLWVSKSNMQLTCLKTA